MANIAKLEAKKDFPEALERANGIITSACREVGISHESYRQWCMSDPEFKKACEEARRNGEELGLDEAESALFRNIKDGKESSIFYYLNNKGKDRGYSKLPPENNSSTVLNLDLSTLSDEQLDRLMDKHSNK
jgi:hypothetical protein